MKPRLVIGGVGDIAFKGFSRGDHASNVLGRAGDVWQACDLVIGNLEGPLSSRVSPSVEGKCPLSSDVSWSTVLHDAGVRVVSLANNHMMDYGPDGLKDTFNALRSASMSWAGAGLNIDEALAPLWVDHSGVKIAIVARSSVVVSSPCYATPTMPGVAPLDLGETESTLRGCRRRADIVVFCPHWGIEHHRYPSPEQRAMACRLIEAGADLILGHHPHVLQGAERIKTGVVAYSLGNFVLDDFDWTYRDRSGETHTTRIRMRDENRRGLIVSIAWEGGGLGPLKSIPTWFPLGGPVRIDQSRAARGEVERLSWPLKLPAYAVFWRLYAARMEWRLRLGPRVFGGGFRRIRRFRFRHLLELVHLLRRSIRVASGRTTNPYE